MMFLSYVLYKQTANMASALGIHPKYTNVYLLAGRVSTRIDHIFLKNLCLDGLGDRASDTYPIDLL